jgi:hypothetical protein
MESFFSTMEGVLHHGKFFFHHGGCIAPWKCIPPWRLYCYMETVFSNGDCIAPRKLYITLEIVLHHGDCIVLSNGDCTAPGKLYITIEIVLLHGDCISRWILYCIKGIVFHQRDFIALWKLYITMEIVLHYGNMLSYTNLHLVKCWVSSSNFLLYPLTEVLLVPLHQHVSAFVVVVVTKIKQVINHFKPNIFLSLILQQH